MRAHEGAGQRGSPEPESGATTNQHTTSKPATNEPPDAASLTPEGDSAWGGLGAGGTSAERDVILYLADVVGGAQGWVFLAFGVGPYRNASGKIRFRFWEEGPFAWPREAGYVLALLREFSEWFDAYICPYVLSGPKRTKGTSVARMVVHCDGDKGLNRAKARTIRGVIIVGSGTPGHAHIHVLLTRSVPPHQHEALCKGLAVYVGAKDPKFSDNDVLRVPGSWNHKPVLDGGQPVPVVWLVRPNGVRAEPEELAALLGVELTDTPPPPAPKPKSRIKSGGDGSAVVFEAEPFDLLRHPSVRRALAKVTGDRSADTMHIVAECFRSRLTLANARWAVRQREDLAGRLLERRDDDIARCWGRAYDSLKGGT